MSGPPPSLVSSSEGDSVLGSSSGRDSSPLSSGSVDSRSIESILEKIEDRIETLEHIVEGMQARLKEVETSTSATGSALEGKYWFRNVEAADD